MMQITSNSYFRIFDLEIVKNVSLCWWRKATKEEKLFVLLWKYVTSKILLLWITLFFFICSVVKNVPCLLVLMASRRGGHLVCEPQGFVFGFWR